MPAFLFQAGNPGMQKSLRDIVAGLIFLGFGAIFAYIASTYPLGTGLRMGPGYFPLVLGAILILLGLVIIIQGVVQGDLTEIGPVPWRGIILITAAVIVFGFGVRRLGLAPSLFLAVLLAAFSSERTTLVSGILMAVGLTVFCILIFVEALGMTVPLIGPWLFF